MTVPTVEKSYIVLVRNALYLPSMKNNMFPNFLLREEGVTVQDTPKMQFSNPTVEEHSIIFPKTSLQISLSLLGTFCTYQHTNQHHDPRK